MRQRVLELEDENMQIRAEIMDLEDRMKEQRHRKTLQPLSRSPSREEFIMEREEYIADIEKLKAELTGAKTLLQQLGQCQAE